MALVLSAVAACGEDKAPTTPNQPGTPTVSAPAGNLFSPSTLQITVGQTVTWVFGPVDHNVIFNPISGAPQDIPSARNTSVTRTFNSAGTFPYTCTLHLGMNGTITVSEASSGANQR